MSIRLVLSSLALYVNWIGFKFCEFIILIRLVFEFQNILKITKSYIYIKLFDLESICLLNFFLKVKINSGKLVP